MLSLTILSTILPLVQCHFTFLRVRINGGDWEHPTQFFRNKTDNYTENHFEPGFGLERGYNYPSFITDYNESMRCGRDHMAHAAQTDILKVRAGDSIQFAHQRWEPLEWKDSQWYNCPDDRGSCDPDFKGFMDFNHFGPVIVHLSKVPDGQDVKKYDGTGEWVKIFTMGFEWRASDEKPLYWKAYNWEQLPPPIIAIIPPQTPAGQYLLRIDYISTGIFYNGTYDIWDHTLSQFYPSCMHINVASEKTGSLPKGVKIPDVLSPDSPGMETSLDMYKFKKIDDIYEYPGGPLWDGEKLVEDKPVRPAT